MQLAERDVRALGEQGWFCVDGFLAPERIALARSQAAVLAAQGRLQAAGIRRGAAHRLDQDVRSDRIAWLDREESGFTDVWAAFEALREQLNREAFMGLSRFELQLGWYPANGARYERHLDAFPGSDNRRVTAIVYLNSDWKPAHGGALRLHVDPPLDLEPLGGRCVVFLSERVEHEVLPSLADRYAIAAWYSR